MGKRSDGQFERIERDFYPTPLKAVLPLLPFLDDVDGFGEPCIGNGDLARHLESFGHECMWGGDIEPTDRAVNEFPVEILAVDDIDPESYTIWGVSHFITNPPWPAPRSRGEPTLGVIRHLSSIRPTWLLLAADFMHNVYAPEVMAYCHKIVSVGRVRWIPDSKYDGKDNACWYLFDQNTPVTPATTFHAQGDRLPVYAASIGALV